MMGCGASSSNNSAPNSASADGYDKRAQHHANGGSDPTALASDTAYAGLKLNETVADAYLRLDDSIYELERQCPGPRLATIEAWLEHLLQIGLAHQTAARAATLAATSTATASQAALAAGNAITIASTTAVATAATATTTAATGSDRSSDERTAIVRLAEQLNVAMDAERAQRNETHLAEVSVRHLAEVTRQRHADVVDHTRDRAALLTEQYGRLKEMYDEQDGLLGGCAEIEPLLVIL